MKERRDHGAAVTCSNIVAQSVQKMYFAESSFAKASKNHCEKRTRDRLKNRLESCMCWYRAVEVDHCRHEGARLEVCISPTCRGLCFLEGIIRKQTVMAGPTWWELCFLWFMRLTSSEIRNELEQGTTRLAWAHCSVGSGGSAQRYCKGLLNPAHVQRSRLGAVYVFGHLQRGPGLAIAPLGPQRQGNVLVETQSKGGAIGTRRRH